MERFVTRYQDRIAGILTGFDRMLFRGTLRSIMRALYFFIAFTNVRPPTRPPRWCPTAYRAARPQLRTLLLRRSVE